MVHMLYCVHNMNLAGYLSVTSLLQHPPFLQYHDLVRVLNGGESVRNYDRRSVATQRREVTHNLNFSLRRGRGRGVTWCTQRR